MDIFVIPAQAGIQWCPSGFRVKPGMTGGLGSFRFILTAYYIPRQRNPVLARLMDAGKQLLATVASIGADTRYSTDELSDVRLSIFLRE